MNRLARIRRPTLSGHQSFPFRHAWLKKGYDRLRGDPAFFSRQDALVDLGVGKNMVDSIRHWLVALGLATPDSGAGKSRRSFRVTPLAHAILRDDGWDPYLEDDGTLWLLHRQLVTVPERATTWWWAFHRPQTVTFRREQLVNEIVTVAEETTWRATRGTVKRDVDCFIRSYLPARGGRATLEDSFSCPLTALGLVQPTLDREEFILSHGWQPSLPDGVFEWGLARYLEEQQAARDQRVTTVPLAQLLFGEGSPGRVFRLGEEALVDRLGRLAAATDGDWLYDETAGLQQLVVRDEVTAGGRLERYYGSAPPEPEQLELA